MAKDIKPEPIVSINPDSVSVNSPLLMPNANGYLYNPHMLLQVNCRGYAIGQFMQPEPSKYSFAPNLEATTFIQPEHHYYAHHPGRFFYLKDNDTGELISLPYEPCRKQVDKFIFQQQQDAIAWQFKHNGLEIEIRVELSEQYIAERWQLSIINQSEREQSLSLYPYFTVGYQSWMNQSARYVDELNAIVASAITPYQKVSQYYENQELKDSTFLLSDKAPDAWLANQQLFEGEGGLANPDALAKPKLDNLGSHYQVACACMQYQLQLKVGEQFDNTWYFGAAKDLDEISAIKDQHFSSTNASIEQAKFSPCIKVNPQYLSAGNQRLFSFVNDWLPRQIDMHGTTNRLTTDPQTRNYLQDNMGVGFLVPKQARSAFVLAMTQQASSGELPDGILLNSNAKLKYINQVPHSDHSAWLSICLLCYLDETNDASLLTELIGFSDSIHAQPVYQHLLKAIDYLLSKRDERGLCYIEQGDWCDPMNMVGHKGKGVSTWLTLATAYSIDCLLAILTLYLPTELQHSLTEQITKLKVAKQKLNDSVNTHCWDGDWYARGINDDGRAFGVKTDQQGRIYLNPQSWALLANATTPAKKYSLLNEVQRQLDTPYGVMMLAPSYTKMDEGIGRICQKSAGIAENGSVYNHAAVFYAYSLYQVGESDLAFSVLAKMLPNECDQLLRGQLPSFIPNYYRGAYYQLPDYAGKSSHLFNTGTVAWFYRCIVEELCGLKGQQGRLLIQPKLPKQLTKLSGSRLFLGAQIDFEYLKKDIDTPSYWLDDQLLNQAEITGIRSGQHYRLTVHLPRSTLE
ncbi:NdvB protein [Thalassotalea sp. LPB0316]|uniref:GH36-type glycosyl hydrolase domain-containing protein n=1 Tax=Thalassotalea sp. LPB0316 TaxID=2769490 RepID=UPI001867608F|nr:NdvB protein [Thalassotalea sp. LPB0316]QOL24594.1 NdvB protein [Thalassotalea sp. LPB0316]